MRDLTKLEIIEKLCNDCDFENAHKKLLEYISLYKAPVYTPKITTDRNIFCDYPSSNSRRIDMLDCNCSGLNNSYRQIDKNVLLNICNIVQQKMEVRLHMARYTLLYLATTQECDMPILETVYHHITKPILSLLTEANEASRSIKSGNL